jgi:flagellar hook-basal body complex protein FliE
MNTIDQSVFSADNLNIRPGAFNPYAPAVGRAHPVPKEGNAFGDSLDMKIQSLRATEASSPAQKVGGAVKNFVLEVDAKGKEADTMRAAVLSGESTNLHQTMIASQEASVSFTLMLEMRNKVMEAYQELMRLQL